MRSRFGVALHAASPTTRIGTRRPLRRPSLHQAGATGWPSCAIARLCSLGFGGTLLHHLAPDVFRTDLASSISLAMGDAVN